MTVEELRQQLKTSEPSTARVDELSGKLQNTQPTSDAVNRLTQQLAQNTYTAKTPEELQAEAERKFTPVYDANKLAAQQAYERNDQALSSQLASLATSYQRQRENTEETVAKSHSNLDRYSLQRGMQRSAYNTASHAIIDNERLRTLSEIDQNMTNAQQGLEGQRTLAAQQLADQLAQYDRGYAADVAAYLDELKDKDFERQQAAQQYNNNLSLQIYQAQAADEQARREAEQYNNQLAMQLYQAKAQEDQNRLAAEQYNNELAMKLYQAQLEEDERNKHSSGSRSSGGSGSGSGSGSSGKVTTPAATTDTSLTGQAAYDKLLAMLGGGKSSSASENNTKKKTSPLSTLNHPLGTTAASNEKFRR